MSPPPLSDEDGEDDGRGQAAEVADQRREDHAASPFAALITAEMFGQAVNGTAFSVADAILWATSILGFRDPSASP